MPDIPDALVAQIRTSSRQLVRELGFMGQTLAGTDLHASAVHAIIEIGAANNLTAKQLAEKLLLEKSTVSRILKALKTRGEIRETRSPSDARTKYLCLTSQGGKTLAAIAAFARSRVSAALAQLAPGQAGQIADALQAYAQALQRCRVAATESENCAGPEIAAGYAPGLIGDVTRLHSTFYARESGFGATFEATVAEGLANFVPRLINPANQIWHVNVGGNFAGSIAIDSEDLGGAIAHLRWFIVSDAVRGSGVGRRLLRTALDHCDQNGFAQTHLWTFQGLDAARRLYEANGFALAEEQWGSQWGTKVREQRFVRPLSVRHGP